MTEKSDAERMANTGSRISLSCGDMIVKELVLEDLIALGGELTTLLSSMDESDLTLGTGGLAWMAHAMKEPAMMKAVQAVAAAATGELSSRFELLPVGDWLKIIKAFKEVMQWEELRELFYGDSASLSTGKLQGDVASQTIATLIDDFASEYGWRVKETLRHTYYQLKSLGIQIGKRRALEKQGRLDLMRTAQHADRSAYDRYRRSLDPLPDSIKEQVTKGGVVIPEGFNYKG